ncbi:uncharacterized protein LOC126969213 isoform X2 [Leptidea sinapis]|nr:uncharacterized protein LOC126969213 isoform X2 [Leptidea sinapis]
MDHNNLALDHNPDAKQNLDSDQTQTMQKEKEDGLLVIKDEKCDSDGNSEVSCNDEHNNVNSDIYQFCERSDSKEDYAVKADDNDTLSDIDDIKTDTASADSEDSALGSLPSDGSLNDREEDVQDRSDGSDSGIGSETVEHINYHLPEPSSCDAGPSLACNMPNYENPISDKKNDENSGHNENIDVKRPHKSSLKRKCDDECIEEPLLKKRKENIKFDNVTVYYFPRAQGFTCVPSQGGSTLGMEWKHSHIQHFTLTEHALEQRRLHRQILQQIKLERHSGQGVSLSSSEESDTEEEASDISESELDLDSYYFLQPVPTKQRRALLRVAGVRKIEGFEKDECRDIRTSREFCGCACKGACNPQTCSCSLAGIKCQVDRLNFPCGCTRDGCCNTTGRIEFNPIRVRTHFINTLMRLGLEKKNEESREAAKRQWAELHSTTTSPVCLPNPFETTCSQNIENKTLHNQHSLQITDTHIISGFSNIHCNLSNSSTPLNINDGHINQRMGNDLNTLNFEEKSQHHDHNTYTNSILQGKGPPFPISNTAYNNSIQNNIQSYPCDLNHSYDQQHSENSSKVTQSYSASSFEEFAQSSHISMFNSYGHMYSTDYMQKVNTAVPGHSIHYQNIAQNPYDMYKNNESAAANRLEHNYHTPLTMPYQASNKLQPIDENWFSHNTLLNLDNNSEQTTQDATETSDALDAPPESDTAEPTENFGELIKKTMVESVTV